MAEIRLQKFLSECSVASRRKSEELIRDGKVWVNRSEEHTSELQSLL